MIKQILKELQDTFGYTVEELSGIESHLEELACHCYWEGYNDAKNDTETVAYKGFAYAKKSDMDGYE